MRLVPPLFDTLHLGFRVCRPQQAGANTTTVARMDRPSPHVIVCCHTVPQGPFILAHAGANDMSELKVHPFFEGVDWSTLRSSPAPDFLPPPPPNEAAEALDWELSSLVAAAGEQQQQQQQQRTSEGGASQSQGSCGGA